MKKKLVRLLYYYLLQPVYTVVVSLAQWWLHMPASVHFQQVISHVPEKTKKSIGGIRVKQ